MELLCMGQRKHSPLVEVSEDFYKRHPNPYIRLFADLPRGPNAVAPPQFGIWPQYSQELAAAIEQVFLKQKTLKRRCATSGFECSPSSTPT